MLNLKKKVNLDNADLEEIGVQSLRCKMSLKQLIFFLELFHVKYTKEHIEKISHYRQHVQRVTDSRALGY